MLRKVARLSRIAAGTSDRRLFMSTMSAASMAMSVPAPMAIPMSAEVRAGASLMPSPTMATLPFFFRRLMTASLPSGSTPAMTSSTPASAPMALAVRSLSPVSITTWMPMFCNSFTARGLSSLITSATAMIPMSCPSSLKNSGVLPFSARALACAFRSSGTAAFFSMKERLPPARVWPFNTPVRPLPGTAVNCSVSPPSMPRSCARARTARDSGCSLFFSSAQALARRVSSV